MNLVLNVINAYWELVFAREDLKAKQKSLQAAEDFLRNIKIKVAAGALAELEIVRAQARAAERQEAIVTAAAKIKDAEDRLRQLFGSPDFPLLSIAEINPADQPTVHAQRLDLASSVNYALSTLPEVRTQLIQIESADLIVARNRHLLLPQLDLTATYLINGLADTRNESIEVVSTMDEAQGSLGLRFSVPLGNRSARGTYTESRYQRLQTLTNYAATERDVTLSVKKAIRDVNTTLQSVTTNRVRVQASQQQLEAEQNKYAVGQNISLDVLDAQEALQQAESALIASIVNFNKAMANYYRQTGRILSVNSIRIQPPAAITTGPDNVKLFP